MKKLFTLLSILLFFVAITNAQTVDIGLKGGVAIPNIVGGNNNPLSEGYKSRFSGNGGFFTEIKFNNHEKISFRFGVEYIGQGGKRNGMQAMSSNQVIMDMATQMSNISEETVALLAQMGALMPPYFYADVKNTAKFDYLMIPLSIQIGKDLGQSPWQVYVNAGPFVSLLMSGEQVSKGMSLLYVDANKSTSVWENVPVPIQTTITSNVPELANVLENGSEFGTSNITGTLRPVNVGVQGNIGLSYKCDNGNKFFAEIGGNYGFVRIQKDKNNGVNRLGAATVMFGYAFNIMK